MCGDFNQENYKSDTLKIDLTYMPIFLVDEDYFLHESKQPEKFSYQIINELSLNNFYIKA